MQDAPLSGHARQFYYPEHGTTHFWMPSTLGEVSSQQIAASQTLCVARVRQSVSRSREQLFDDLVGTRSATLPVPLWWKKGQAFVAFAPATEQAGSEGQNEEGTKDSMVRKARMTE